MNIEEFYDADPRRRASEEIEFGRDWHDADGKRYEVSWVVDTGEVYLMREPTEPIDTDPAFGTQFVEPMDVDTMTVEVLGTVTTPEELADRLTGWQDRMPEDDSIAWVRGRIA